MLLFSENKLERLIFKMYIRWFLHAKILQYNIVNIDSQCHVDIVAH
jgi:hypothetical protein